MESIQKDDEDPENPFTDSSQPIQQPEAAIATNYNNLGQSNESLATRKEKKRVEFSSRPPPQNPRESPVRLRPSSGPPSPVTPERFGDNLPPPAQSPVQFEHGSRAVSPLPRSALRRSNSSHSALPLENEEELQEISREKAIRDQKAKEARERAKRLAQKEQGEDDWIDYSEHNSRQSSPDGSLHRYPSTSTQSWGGDGESVASTQGLIGSEPDEAEREMTDRDTLNERAYKLVQSHTLPLPSQEDYNPEELYSGLNTPTEGQEYLEDYRTLPKHYRGGVLSALLRLYNQPQPSHSRRSGSTGRSRSRGRSRQGAPNPFRSPARGGPDYFNFKGPANEESQTATSTLPADNRRSWRGKKAKHQKSAPSISHIVGSSASLGSPSVTHLREFVHDSLGQAPHLEKARHGKRSPSNGPLAALDRIGKSRHQEDYRITVHIAEIISRQKYLMRLCRALMLYGAPTHRLEEYMNMSARVLEIQAQFLYIPGSMVISFDDPSTHTAEVKLVRITQGLDLGKLHDTHEVYKDVVHDRIGVEEATTRLKEIADKKEKHNRWVRIVVSGIACASVGPFSFGGRLIDVPICFILGTLLAFLQLVVTPQSDLYANIFEVAATIIASFLSRAFGSIRGSDGNYMFCFAAVSQSSIALILPGYAVLCSALELQSKSIIAGSVRLVYAIIYSLFLGYGITIGSTIYGILDKNATSETVCPNPMAAPYTFPWVVVFTLCMIVLYQAKWKQAPTQIVIAFVGYLVSYYSSQRFKDNAQISSTLAALAIGVLANLYSRIGGKIENKSLDIWEDHLASRWNKIRCKIQGDVHKEKVESEKMEEGSAPTDNKYDKADGVRPGRRVGYGLAAAAMLPAIFVQVPGGLAVSGGLISGIASADQLAGNKGNTSATLGPYGGTSGMPLTVAYSVIQIAIGITVGLFLAAIAIYPFGKKRSGLFSF